MKPKFLMIGSLQEKKIKGNNDSRKNNNKLATKLETLQNLIYETLDSCKRKYNENISKKLCSKATTPKYYWSLLKTMLNDKKVPCIPPIFHDNKFVTGFSRKVYLFNSFLQNSDQLLKITVLSPHQLILLPISTWQTLNLWKKALKESSVNLILIKLMVMI